MKKYILLTILVLGLLACEENDSSNINQDVTIFSSYKIFRDGSNFLENRNLLADIHLTSYSFFNGRFSQLNEYRGNAEIWGDSLHTISVNAGDVIIGGTGPLSAIQSEYTPNYWSYSTQEYHGSWNENTPPFDLNFGSNQRWYIEGNSSLGVSEVDINLYIPKLFEITSGLNGEYGINNSVDRTQDWTITWDAETYNSEGKVALIFFYDKGNSRSSERPNLPATIDSYQILVDDTGSYTFPSSFLLNWPKGAFFQMIMGRGKYDIVEKPEGFYRFSTITMTDARLIMD